MDFYETVNNRRSIRNFTDEKIPEEAIRRIIEAAYKAPANDHFRDWHYIVITEKDKMREVIDGVPKNLTEKDVDNMTFISDPEQKRAYQIAVPMQYRMLIGAAAIIIPLMKKKCDILHPSSLSDLNCYASVWCSIENLWLAAVAEGYACNLRIPLGDEESIARKVLGFPENYMIPCFIGVGKATEDAVKTKQIDINIDELLHWEKY